MTRRRRPIAVAAFTLIEVMVVMAIILILVGLIATIYAAAKTRAFITVDSSNLRQMGQAGAIYAGDNDDRYPLSVRPLYSTGLVPAGICKSALDHTPNGIAARFVSALDVFPKEEFLPLVPTTYIGPREGGWTWESFTRKVLDGRNPGWLINLVMAKPTRGGYYQGASGPYHRLLMDGSVQARTMGYQSMFIDGQFETKIVQFKSYFCDP